MPKPLEAHEPKKPRIFSFRGWVWLAALALGFGSWAATIALVMRFTA